MDNENSVVVIGCGLAAAAYASELRRLGFGGNVILVGDEPQKPYDRPPLSKEYLFSGDPASTKIEMPELASCEFILGDAAVEVDVAAKQVALKSGRRLPYGTLVFATGASAKAVPPLEFPAPVFRLRTLEDADALREALKPGRQLVVVGGGVIGLEVAATARKLGAEVTVIEAAPRLLSRNACEELATFLREAHEHQGVKFHFGGFKSVSRDGFVLSDGSILRADAVLWATGAAPNDQLAKAIGVECQDGILVDELGHTNVRDVYAIGDVARLRVAGPEGVTRHETWTAAKDQAENAAKALMVPGFVPKASAFYYWTDQYDFKVQVIGTAVGQQNVHQPSDKEGVFTIYHLNNGHLEGVSLVNNLRLMSVAKRVVQKSPVVDPEALRVASFNLKSLV